MPMIMNYDLRAKDRKKFGGYLMVPIESIRTMEDCKDLATLLFLRSNATYFDMNYGYIQNRLNYTQNTRRKVFKNLVQKRYLIITKSRKSDWLYTIHAFEVPLTPESLNDDLLYFIFASGNIEMVDETLLPRIAEFEKTYDVSKIIDTLPDELEKSFNAESNFDPSKFDPSKFERSKIEGLSILKESKNTKGFKNTKGYQGALKCAEVPSGIQFKIKQVTSSTSNSETGLTGLGNEELLEMDSTKNQTQGAALQNFTNKKIPEKPTNIVFDAPKKSKMSLRLIPEGKKAPATDPLEQYEDAKEEKRNRQRQRRAANKARKNQELLEQQGIGNVVSYKLGQQTPMEVKLAQMQKQLNEATAKKEDETRIETSRKVLYNKVLKLVREDFSDKPTISKLMSDFIMSRYEQKHPVTPEAYKTLCERLYSAGRNDEEYEEIIKTALCNGWGSFYSVKGKKVNRKKLVQNPVQPSATNVSDTSQEYIDKYGAILDETGNITNWDEVRERINQANNKQ